MWTSRAEPSRATKADSGQRAVSSERVVGEERTPAFTYGRTPVVAAGRRIALRRLRGWPWRMCGKCTTGTGWPPSPSPPPHAKARRRSPVPSTWSLPSCPPQPLFSLSSSLPPPPLLPHLYKRFLRPYYARTDADFLFSFLDYINDDENPHWLRDRRNLVKLFPFPPSVINVFLVLTFARSLVRVFCSRTFSSCDSRWRCIRETSGPKASVSSFQMCDHVSDICKIYIRHKWNNLASSFARFLLF